MRSFSKALKKASAFSSSVGNETDSRFWKMPESHFGEEFSSVTGYVIEDVFFGHIFLNNEMYYVDPFKVLCMKLKHIIS